MLISELFKEHKETINIDDELFEDLGNLNEIDKDLMKVLMKNVKYKYNKSWGTGRGTYSQQISDKLPDYLGKNSLVRKEPIKSATALHAAIKENELVKAVVLEFDGKQVFATLKTPKNPDLNASNKPIYFWMANYEKLFGTPDIPSEYGNFIKDLTDNRVLDNRYAQGSEKEMEKAISTVIKVRKGLGKVEMNVIVVYTDEERAKLHKQRTSMDKNDYDYDEKGFPILKNPPKEKISKADIKKQAASYDAQEIASFRNEKGINNKMDDISVARTMAIRELDGKVTKKFNDNVKSYLNARLSKFKSAHADEATTPEEFLQMIKESGYLEKIKVNGIVYKYSDESNVSIRRAKEYIPGKSAEWDRPYISYRIDDYGPSYEEYKTYGRKMREQFVELYGEDTKEFDNAMQKYTLPREIKIFLKLDKSSIVVDEINVKGFVKWKK